MDTMNSFRELYICCINSEPVLLFFNIYVFSFIHSNNEISWIVSSSVDMN